MLGWSLGFCLTSDLLLQIKNDSHGLVEDEQFRLRFLAFQVHLAHPPQLLERLVDVSHSQALAGVVRHPPLTLPLSLLLWIQVLVLSETVERQHSFTAGTGVVPGDLQRSTLNMNMEVSNSDTEVFGNILHVCTLCACLVWVSSYFCRCHHPPCCLWRGYQTCRPCLVSPPSAPGRTRPGPKKDLLWTTYGMQETDRSVATAHRKEFTHSQGWARPLKASAWWLSSVLDVELELGRPPWLLFRLAASSA